MTLRTRKVTGTFEKRALVPNPEFFIAIRSVDLSNYVI